MQGFSGTWNMNMTSIFRNLKKNAIWLIDMGDDKTWCDCPDPSPGIDPKDIDGPYILDADKRIAELEAENERLAARVKELGAQLSWWQDAAPIIADAERYRWGLANPSMMANYFIKWRSNADHYNCRNTGRHPSEAIDEAMND